MRKGRVRQGNFAMEHLLSASTLGGPGSDEPEEHSATDDRKSKAN